MDNQQKTITPRVILQMLLFIVVIPFLPLLISGQWDWWEAWVYALISILGFVISRVLAARRHPDIIAERARSMQHENIQPWDKKVNLWLGLGGLLVMLIIGLDARFGWPPTFSLPVKILSLILILAGYALGSYALIENRFFSATVRLQTERGHQVVSSGPYRWMRHPGYAGALLTNLATPFFLDSLWALLPTVLLWVFLIIRTALEDRFLQAELAGYREYAGQVRYRLLPGIW
jgi:protein-S-isoprenylcysteine O-methyltransferase Ste14